MNRSFGGCIVFLSAVLVCANTFAQQHSSDCSAVRMRSILRDYVASNALVKPGDKMEVRFVTPSGSKGVCIAQLEYSFAPDHLAKYSQTLFISADGRYVFPRAVDVSRKLLGNFLKNLRIDGFPTYGPSDAPVQIVVFSDFECPFCRVSGLEVKNQIQAKFGSQVQWVFKWLPLSGHPLSEETAIGSACVFKQSQSSFWELHDQLFEQQNRITPQKFRSFLLNFAAKAKLNISFLNHCLSSNAETASLIRGSFLEARTLGVSSTPTIFVNGRLVRFPADVKNVEEIISEELRKIAPHSRGEVEKVRDQLQEVRRELGEEEGSSAVMLIQTRTVMRMEVIDNEKVQGGPILGNRSLVACPDSVNS